MELLYWESLARPAMSKEADLPRSQVFLDQSW